MREKDIRREFKIEPSKLRMLKTKLIKKNLTLEKLAKKHKFKQEKPACLANFKLRSKKCLLRLDKEKEAFVKETLADSPNLTLPELRTMIKRQFLM